MSLDRNLEIVATGVQAALIAFLVFRGLFRKLPLFSTYVVWLFLAPGAISFLAKHLAKHLSSPNSYEHIFIAAAIFDAFLMLCVLAELSMSVLSPIRDSLPRWTVFAVGTLLAIVFAVIWPFAKPHGYGDLLSISQYIVHFDLTTSVLRIFFFLGLAACSQALSIGWRDRELQVATGLGFYAFIALAASVVQMNIGTAASTIQTYHLMDEVQVIGFILCSTYWIVSFAQKVPERREFTPQMEDFLLALAGTARSARVSMRDSDEFKKRKKRD